MPNIDGGPQEDPRWNEPDEPKAPVESTQKFDFQNIDVKLYLALKALLENQQDPIQLEKAQEQAELALAEFELSHGPLPDWAIGRNWDYSLQPGAQLMTKDGRRTGNAHVLRCYTKGFKPTAVEHNYDMIQLFDCITDAGSFICGLSESELESQYWVGDFISDPKTLIARFGNHGEDYGLPQQGDPDV